MGLIKCFLRITLLSADPRRQPCASLWRRQGLGFRIFHITLFQEEWPQIHPFSSVLPIFLGSTGFGVFSLVVPDAFPIPASHQLPAAAALGCNCSWRESCGERKALSWQRAREQPSCKTPQFLPLIKDVAIFYLRNPLLALKVALQLTKNKARSTTPVCIPRSRA